MANDTTNSRPTLRDTAGAIGNALQQRTPEVHPATPQQYFHKTRTISATLDRVRFARNVGFEPDARQTELLLCDSKRGHSQGFGLGQSGILNVLPRVIRIEYPHGWRRGYTLNMENPLS